MDDDQRARGAIDRLAKRIQDSHKRVGRDVPFEQARKKARESARRHDERD